MIQLPTQSPASASAQCHGFHSTLIILEICLFLRLIHGTICSTQMLLWLQIHWYSYENKLYSHIVCYNVTIHLFSMFRIDYSKNQKTAITNKKTFCRRMNWCIQTYQSFSFHLIRSFINGMQHMVSSDSLYKCGIFWLFNFKPN